ncbi:cytochrome c [uncultured Jannaschia sp.]|uniref:c-type cytochrome n=1 Tax=uncultured Jannaschia sp. TaxID=293347 RepID=UPI00261D7EF7|nr:cytochrome c [uncultured Jannaschia sp.]
MKPAPILAAGGALVAVAALAALASLAQDAGPEPAEELAFLGEPVTAEQLRLGQDVYAANCAACHGADLEGQPDWRRRLEDGRAPAPPHDESGHTWHHSDRNLFTITKLGIGAIVPGYASDMPAFGDVLSDAEIAAALAYIKSTWPARQRGFQAEVTANDEGEL